MHILDILEHGKCSVLIFCHKYHNYNKNPQIFIFFNCVNLQKREKATLGIRTETSYILVTNGKVLHEETFHGIHQNSSISAEIKF